MARTYAPRGLGPAGKQLWRSARHLLDAGELGAGGRALLLEACRCADDCERLAKEVDATRLLFAELRHQRDQLARLLAQLGIS